MNGPVVVGVDGSPSGLAAAAREAERRGVGLELAHALVWSWGPVPAGVAPWDPDGVRQRDRVNEALTDAEWRVRKVAPELVITREVLVGEAVSVLEREARAASLAVVGTHRVRGLRRLLHGSTAGHLSAHGSCPVLVVRGRQNGTGPVVLVDMAGLGRRPSSPSPRPRSAAWIWWSCITQVPGRHRALAAGPPPSPCPRRNQRGCTARRGGRAASERHDGCALGSGRPGDPAVLALLRRSGALREGMKAGGPDGDRRHGPFSTVFLDRWRLLRFTRSVRPSPISPRISRSRGDVPLSARRAVGPVVAGPAGTASIRPRGSRQTEMPSPVRQPYVQDGRHDRPHRRCPHELVPHVPGVTDDWESGSVANRSALPRRTTPWPSRRRTRIGSGAESVRASVRSTPCSRGMWHTDAGPRPPVLGRGP